MRYEQIVTLYCTIVTEAENKEEAQKKIHKELDEMKFEHNIYFGKDNEIIIGEYDREGDVKLMK